MINTLILTDNPYAYDLALELNCLYGNIDIFQSPAGELVDIPSLNIREQEDYMIANYDLIISIHCKQFFSSRLVNNIRCINVHPGMTPYNRGWYPQVFSIINGLPCGVTIHEMDEKLDHGPVIFQKEYIILPWDTSGSVYHELMKLEREMMLKNFFVLRNGSYDLQEIQVEGNLNSKKEFDALKEIDLNQRGTFGEFINRLRALTHDNFENAYFLEPSGKKVFVKVNFELDGTK